MEKKSVNIDEMSSEKLGLFLDSQYKELLRVQSNIVTILKTLEGRDNDAVSKTTGGTGQ